MGTGAQAANSPFGGGVSGTPPMQAGSVGSGIGSAPMAAPGGVIPPTPGQTYNPNQQVAPLTQQQLQAMQGVSTQAGPSQNFLNTAMGEQNYIAGGGLLSPQSNPYLNQYFNAAAEPLVQQYEQATAPNILANAASTGTLGSAGMNQAFQNADTSLSQGLGNLAAGIYEPAYQSALSTTNQAAQNAPNLAQGQFIPSSELQQSGQIGQQQAQNVLNTSYQNLYGQAQWPFQALNMLGQGLNTASGGGSTGISIGTMPSSGSGK